MFRCFIGKGPMSESDLETRINDWVASNGEWTDDNTPHTLDIETTGVDNSGTQYYAIDVRFLPDNSKSNILQKFTDKLKDKVDWYRVGYHPCTKRDGDGSSGPCEWTDKTEWTAKDVSVPEGVPKITGV